MTLCEKKPSKIILNTFQNNFPGLLKEKQKVKHLNDGKSVVEKDQQQQQKKWKKDGTRVLYSLHYFVQLSVFPGLATAS